MARYRLFGSKRLAKASLDVSVAAAPAVSSADTAFSHNSRASAAAVAELSQSLEFVLDELDGQGGQDGPGDVLQLHLDRLADEAAKYSNATLDEDDAQEWTWSPDTAHLVRVACQCANLTYTARLGPDHDDDDDEDLVCVANSPASVAGTNKAFSLWRADALNALVVAVRGTSAIPDHAVNLNSDLCDASAVLNMPPGIAAHSGFVSCAKAILPKVQHEINRHAAAAAAAVPIQQIIFTGHSAGGAVASLLFLSMAAAKCPSHLKLSLVTFGSAPVTASDTTPLVRTLSNVGTVLALVNEFDMVPRADKAYIQSVIDLYRSRYGLASLHHSNTPGETAAQGRVWPLPTSPLHLVGDIIMSKRIFRPEFGQGPYKMFHVPHDIFGQLLFTGLAEHKRKVYLERFRSGLEVEGSWSEASTLRTAESHYSKRSTF